MAIKKNHLVREREGKRQEKDAGIDKTSDQCIIGNWKVKKGSKRQLEKAKNAVRKEDKRSKEGA